MIDVTGAPDPAAVAASLFARFGISTDPARRGPVPLARIFDECNLLHVTLPRLTRARIAEYLLGEGIMTGTLTDSGDPDEVLAGFIFTAGADGFVFVGERELSAADDGQQPTPLGRRRFTAAHELGHFLLHRDRMVGGRWIGDTKETIREADGTGAADMEREADRFAAELLMPANVCRIRAEAFRAAYHVCPLAAFAYHLSSELLVSPEAMRYRLGRGVWGYAMSDEAVRQFFRRYGGRAVAMYPPQPEFNAVAANREEFIEWGCEVPAQEWQPIGPFPETPSRPGEFPERFTDGCLVSHPVTTIIAPKFGWRIPILLGEVGGIAMRLKGRVLLREFFGLERVISFVTDPFPWSEVENFVGGVSNLPDFPLRVLPAALPAFTDPLELFDYEKMRKAAYNRTENEMTNWEAIAFAADRTTATLVDGRLEPRVRSSKAAKALPLVVGVVKTHTTNYLHAQGWRTLFELKPIHRTPYFRIAKTMQGGSADLPIVSWYVKMAMGEEEMPNWAVVRVEVPWVQFESRWSTDGERTGFVNRLSRWLIDARCRQPSYARMPVSLEPIVRAEDSLKSLFTPFGVLRNRFLRHADVMGGIR